MPLPRLLPCLAVLVLAGCDLVGVDCTTSVEPGIVLELYDAQTTAPITAGAEAELRDGAYIEVLAQSAEEGEASNEMPGAWERPGTYDITVEHRLAAIDLGAVGDATANTLQLSAVELANVSTDILRIGQFDAGAITISDAIIPTMTFAATGEAVTYFGAKPVLVDCTPDTLNIDPAAIDRAITPRTISTMLGPRSCARARSHGPAAPIARRSAAIFMRRLS